MRGEERLSPTGRWRGERSDYHLLVDREYRSTASYRLRVASTTDFHVADESAAADSRVPVREESPAADCRVAEESPGAESRAPEKSPAADSSVPVVQAPVLKGGHSHSRCRGSDRLHMKPVSVIEHLHCPHIWMK